MITDTLICVLLYLNVITASGHYTVNDVNNFATIYAVQINTIENNLPLLDAIIPEEEPDAIWVISDMGG